MDQYQLDMTASGNIYRVNGFFTREDSDGSGTRSFTVRVKNRSGEWISVDVDRSLGVASTQRIKNGENGSFSESLQLYLGRQNKITRWRPGFLGAPGNGGGEVLFFVPADAYDVVIELEVVG